MNNWISSKPDLLPDFIIGGAMKSGTSTLHAILDKHHRVFIPQEEVHFFDIDNLLQHGDFNFHTGKQWVAQSMEEDPELMWNWYHRKYRGKQNFIKGEDSTTYLASRVAAKRIAMQEKPIKLIFLLRQPTSRTFSNYCHLLRNGRATHSFEDTLRFNPYRVISRSLYKEQLENYYRYIPKSRIKVLLFEDLVKNTEAVVKEVCDFLELDYSEFPEDVLDTYANKGRMPRFISLQLRKNLLMRNFGSVRYNNLLPFQVSEKHRSDLSLGSLINKAHSVINPLSPDASPKINAETREFLDRYFYNELDGIDELTGKEILSKWFPKAKESPKAVSS